MMSPLRASPILVVENASLTFGASETAVTALSNVSFEVRPGELLLLMGPSGSGKTSLLQMIGGLIRPTAGEIYIAGQPLSELDEDRLSEIRLTRLGFIFQSYQLLRALRAWENVGIAFELLKAERSTIEARSRALLADLGLGSRADAFPSELSGGQRQRVAIARALAGQPGILLADEPTAALDSTNGDRVGHLLRTISHREGRAVIVATHDRRLNDVADRIIHLEDGKMVDIGQRVAAAATAVV